MTASTQLRLTRPAAGGSVSGRRAGGIRLLIDRVVALVVLLAAWQLGSTRFGPDVVPGPGRVTMELGRLLGQSVFWAAVGDTCASTLIGLFIAAVLAIPLGLLTGRHPIADASTKLTVDFLRTIPAVTLIPLVVLLFGPSQTMKVVLIVFGAFWPLFVQATYAARELDPVARDMVRSYRLRDRVVWAAVLLPSSAPFLITGLRVATTLALLLSVGAEIVGNAPGIGQQITLAQIGAQSATAYAYVVVAALLGVVINAAAAFGQGRLLFWHPSVRGRFA